MLNIVSSIFQPENISQSLQKFLLPNKRKQTEKNYDL